MSADKTAAGSVLRIERSSIHDGLGLRTVIFLKGCPLNCSWCSTPESKEFAFEKGYAAELCSGSACGRCIESCPEKAISYTDDHLQVQTEANKCTRCSRCVGICPSNALKMYGTTLSVSEVMREVSKDEIFYFYSGGGVTLSGGEPLSQAGFSAAVLKKCKVLGINTAMESSLYSNYESIMMILPWLDDLYVDIKHMDSSVHRKWVGKDNRLVLENITKMDQSTYPLTIVVRIPLIPGFNDSDQNLLATLRFCKGLSRLNKIELLPYHRLGSETYRHLGLNNPCIDLIPPTADQLSERVAFMKQQNSKINICAGSGFTSE